MCKVEKHHFVCSKSRIVLDEVKDIITLPKYNPKSTKQQKKLKDVQISSHCDETIA
jgi:hypothetical protein